MDKQQEINKYLVRQQKALAIMLVVLSLFVVAMTGMWIKWTKERQKLDNVIWEVVSGE